MNKRENFGSKIGAILATAGSAVGLGNIWRFPIETGKNGGAAFILIYIICILLLGLPLMLSEFVIGRNTQSNATGAYHKLAPGTHWKWVGRLRQSNLCRPTSVHHDSFTFHSFELLCCCGRVDHEICCSCHR